MDVLKRGTGILPVKDERFPTKCRKKSRARCPCHAISLLPLYIAALVMQRSIPPGRHCEPSPGRRGNLVWRGGDDCFVVRRLADSSQ
jgi:hypothetical protein